jgi:hypothetical protein
MIYKIEEILETKPNDWQGLTRTIFTAEGQGPNAIYILTKPENAPVLGSQLEGSIAPDRGGKLKFTKTPGTITLKSGEVRTVSGAAGQSKPMPYPKRDDSAIKAQWAIGQAVQLLIASGASSVDRDKLEEQAKELFAMVERVKGQPNEAAMQAIQETLPGSELV